jgi:chemotaxis protein methyltransferase CheR
MRSNETHVNVNRNASQTDSIFQSRPLSDAMFQKISSMIYDMCRINLHVGKKELVQARLNKRLRLLNIKSYREYLRYVEEEPTGMELINMVDHLTTNLTFFFRESTHFDYLRSEVLKKTNLKANPRLRIWSAGCSSGEEAYSIAITLRENLSDIDRADVKILATDISTKVLAVARAGTFSPARFKDTPSVLRDKYFDRRMDSNGEIFFQARPEIMRLLTFHRLNLMDQWPMTGLFNVVMCRNVMIYFDKQTQAELVARFHNVLAPGGIFMVGHSESLTGISHGFRYVRPSVYIKP